MDNKFNEADKEKVIKFLNLIAKHARFDVNVEELLEVRNGLAHMQQVIVPKIDANILEIKKVHEPESPKPESKEE
jgi:hypothetical protein